MSFLTFRPLRWQRLSVVALLLAAMLPLLLLAVYSTGGSPPPVTQDVATPQGIPTTPTTRIVASSIPANIKDFGHTEPKKASSTTTDLDPMSSSTLPSPETRLEPTTDALPSTKKDAIPIVKTMTRSFHKELNDSVKREPKLGQAAPRTLNNITNGHGSNASNATVLVVEEEDPFAELLHGNKTGELNKCFSPLRQLNDSVAKLQSMTDEDGIKRLSSSLPKEDRLVTKEEGQGRKQTAVVALALEALQRLFLETNRMDWRRLHYQSALLLQSARKMLLQPPNYFASRQNDSLVRGDDVNRTNPTGEVAQLKGALASSVLKLLSPRNVTLSLSSTFCWDLPYFLQQREEGELSKSASHTLQKKWGFNRCSSTQAQQRRNVLLSDQLFNLRFPIRILHASFVNNNPYHDGFPITKRDEGMLESYSTNNSETNAQEGGRNLTATSSKGFSFESILASFNLTSSSSPVGGKAAAAGGGKRRGKARPRRKTPHIPIVDFICTGMFPRTFSRARRDHDLIQRHILSPFRHLVQRRHYFMFNSVRDGRQRLGATKDLTGKKLAMRMSALQTAVIEKNFDTWIVLQNRDLSKLVAKHIHVVLLRAFVAAFFFRSPRLGGLGVMEAMQKEFIDGTAKEDDGSIPLRVAPPPEYFIWARPDLVFPSSGIPDHLASVLSVDLVPRVEGEPDNDENHSAGAHSAEMSAQSTKKFYAVPDPNAGMRITAAPIGYKIRVTTSHVLTLKSHRVFAEYTLNPHTYLCSWYGLAHDVNLKPKERKRANDRLFIAPATNAFGSALLSALEHLFTCVKPGYFEFIEYYHGHALKTERLMRRMQSEENMPKGRRNHKFIDHQNSNASTTMRSSPWCCTIEMMPMGDDIDREK